MTSAERLAATPSQQVIDSFGPLGDLAASGGSEAVRQFDRSDGSVLLVRVREGEVPVFECIPPPPPPVVVGV